MDTPTIYDPPPLCPRVVPCPGRVRSLPHPTPVRPRSPALTVDLEVPLQVLAADEALEADGADVRPLVGVYAPVAGHVRLPLQPDVTQVTFESAAQHRPPGAGAHSTARRRTPHMTTQHYTAPEAGESQ